MEDKPKKKRGRPRKKKTEDKNISDVKKAVLRAEPPMPRSIEKTREPRSKIVKLEPPVPVAVDRSKKYRADEIMKMKAADLRLVHADQLRAASVCATCKNLKKRAELVGTLVVGKYFCEKLQQDVGSADMRIPLILKCDYHDKG